MKRNKKDKVLNLYAGLGGNRKLWTGVNVTAVELNSEIAYIYQSYFPNDTVIIGDAHQYLLKNYKEYDFIWSSPPCQSHTSLRKNFAFCEVKKYLSLPPMYIDMKLYQEIIFLDNFFKGRFVVENMNPYYEPLIKARKKINRHLFWSNFRIGSFFNLLTSKGIIVEANLKELQASTGFDLSKFKIKHRKDTLLKNCVNSEIGLYIYNESKRQGMFKIKELL